MKRAVQIVATVYAVLCVATMMAIPISNYGWFGITRAPWAQSLAAILSMPWSLGLRLLSDPDPFESGALLICAMTANVALLFWLAEIVGRRGAAPVDRTPRSP